MLLAISCNRSNSSTTQKRILEIAIFEGAYGDLYWKEIIKRFENKNPDITISMISSPRIEEVIRARNIAGNPPDFVYLTSMDLTNTMVTNGDILPLNDVFDSDLEKTILDGFLDYCKPMDDGNIYFAPAYYAVTGLWYNKKLFEKQEWKLPETWDDFYNFNIKAKSINSSLLTYQGLYPSYNEAILIPAIASSGGLELLNRIKTYEKLIWTNPEVLKALDIFNTIYQNNFILPGTVALNHTQAQREFIQGRALFIPCGSWLPFEMESIVNNEEFSFGFYGSPVFQSGDDPYILTIFENFFIPQKARNIDDAKKFLRFHYEIENIILNAKLSSGVMPVKGALELVRDYLDPSTYEAYRIFDEGAKPVRLNLNLIPGFNIDFQSELYDPITQIMEGKINSIQWAEKLNILNEKILSSNEKRENTN